MSYNRLFVSALLALAASSSSALAQPPKTPPPGFPTGVRAGRVVVDGAKNPERIPDRVAIGMFMSVIAIPAQPDQRTIKSWYAKVAPLKLSPRDTGVLRTELSKLHAKLQAHRETMIAASDNLQRSRTPVAAATFTAVAEARDTLAVDSYERVLTQLSPGAAGKLRAHINVVKKQIRGIGPAR